MRAAKKPTLYDNHGCHPKCTKSTLGDMNNRRCNLKCTDFGKIFEVDMEEIIDKERTINRIKENVYEKLKFRRWGDKLIRIDNLRNDKIYLLI